VQAITARAAAQREMCSANWPRRAGAIEAGGERQQTELTIPGVLVSSTDAGTNGFNG
jgi:hypothetical protein